MRGENALDELMSSVRSGKAMRDENPAERYARLKIALGSDLNAEAQVEYSNLQLRLLKINREIAILNAEGEVIIKRCTEISGQDHL